MVGSNSSKGGLAASHYSIRRGLLVDIAPNSSFGKLLQAWISIEISARPICAPGVSDERVTRDLSLN
jgi:hypothetical protein